MKNEPYFQGGLADALSNFTPSEKLVFKALQYTGKLTQKELAEETRLSQRTVRYATQTLEENGIVTSRTYLQDARQRLYSITESYHTDEINESQ